MKPNNAMEDEDDTALVVVRSYASAYAALLRGGSTNTSSMAALIFDHGRLVLD
jgi:hypothetical protein